MGFKRKSSLKLFHNIKHAYFVYPDEKKSGGSSQSNDALIKELISQDKIAIVKFIPRENSTVQFYALFPQDKKLDSDDDFETPAGLFLDDTFAIRWRSQERIYYFGVCWIQVTFERRYSWHPDKKKKKMQLNYLWKIST